MQKQKNSYVKIKNVLPNVNLYDIYMTMGLASLMLIPILLSVFLTIMSAMQSYKIHIPYNIKEIFNVLYIEFIDSPIQLQLLYVLLIILFFGFVWLTINNIKVYKAEILKAYNSENFISYFKFTDNKIYLAFTKGSKIKEINYSDIDSMKLSLVAFTQHSGKYGFSSTIIDSLSIYIESDSLKYEIYNKPVDLNNLYKIIYFSQYVKNFSYNFDESDANAEKTYKEVIDDYIANGYKKTCLTRMYSPVNPAIIVLIVIIMYVFLYKCLNNY